VARPKIPQRARRWDALVLGGALPGLVAAARLAVAGQRVLILEEKSAAELPRSLREPFFLAGARGGLLEACLKDLHLPLIEQRALEPDPVAFQLVLPEARLDLGEPQLYADELVAWGIEKPEPARALVRALANAAEAERAAMEAAPVVKAGGLRGLARGGGRPSLHGRGLPVEASGAEGALAAILDAQVRALSNLGATSPPPEARARLLGLALAGGASFPSTELGLRELLLRRIRARHGELRTLEKPFAFAVAGEHPALAVDGVNELWAGRALLVNAPPARLARQLEAWDRPVPAFLAEARPATHRRVSILLRCETRRVPEGMGRALVRVRDPEAPAEGTNVVAIARHPVADPEGGEPPEQEIVASSVVEDRPEARGAVEQEIEKALRDLMPFSEGHGVRESWVDPGWDDEAVLADPARGQGWPGELELRVSSRPPVHVLPREGLAALGLEGDLLLGWRAGDALAAELG
jgi:hypothetical protein